MKKWLPLVTLIFSGCHYQAEPVAPQVIQVEEATKDILIPTSLWDAIEGKSKESASAKKEKEKKDKKEEAKEGEAPAEAPEGGGNEFGGGALFMPIAVILEEKNAGVLQHSPLRLEFPRGGGSVDFSKYLTGEPGSFFVKFEWPDMEEAENMQSWYVSKAHRRKIGSEYWGTGCNKYFKITQGLQKALKTGGLKLNTTHERHLTVLGGHFVFSGRKNGQTFVSQITFKDSAHPEYFCQEL